MRELARAVRAHRAAAVFVRIDQRPERGRAFEPRIECRAAPRAASRGPDGSRCRRSFHRHRRALVIPNRARDAQAHHRDSRSRGCETASGRGSVLIPRRASRAGPIRRALRAHPTRRRPTPMSRLSRRIAQRSASPAPRSASATRSRITLNAEWPLPTTRMRLPA